MWFSSLQATNRFVECCMFFFLSFFFILFYIHHKSFNKNKAKKEAAIREMWVNVVNNGNNKYPSRSEKVKKNRSTTKKRARAQTNRKKRNETSSLCKSFHMIYSYNKDLFLLFDLIVCSCVFFFFLIFPCCRYRCCYCLACNLIDWFLVFGLFFRWSEQILWLHFSVCYSVVYPLSFAADGDNDNEDGDGNGSGNNEWWQRTRGFCRATICCFGYIEDVSFLSISSVWIGHARPLHNRFIFPFFWRFETLTSFSYIIKCKQKFST